MRRCEGVGGGRSMRNELRKADDCAENSSKRVTSVDNVMTQA
jgi:hypothetical protein